MRASACAVASIVLLTCFVSLAWSGEPTEENILQKDEAPKQQLSKRASLAPNKLFDFGRYKVIFKKRYNSLMEELARRKIFLARAFSAFLSFISYKHYRKSHYLRVNELSDWTNDELRMLEMTRTKRDAHKMSRLDSIKGGLADPAATDIEEIELKLGEIVQAEDPALQLIAAELPGASPRLRKRQAASRDRSSLRAEDLLEGPMEPEEASSLSVEQVPSNNPHYEVPELTSFGGADKDIVSPTSMLELKLISGLNGVSYLTNLIAKTAKDLYENLTAARPAVESIGDNKEEEKDTQTEKLPDEIFVDHRKSGCLTPVKNQNRCGSCFIFSSTALYEYHHCMETKRLVAFSEQYPIDCGGRLGIDGCVGGAEEKVSEYFYRFGIELASNYPYRHRKDSCPYDESSSEERMGYIRVKEPKLKWILQCEFRDYLPRMPIITGVAVSPDFHGYGGGVDEGQDCDPHRPHSMLVVGHGREDGLEYLLLRNSYGPSWGEGGYYKISKEADHCFLESGIGWVLEPENGGSVFGEVNTQNDGNAVREHIRHIQEAPPETENQDQAGTSNPNIVTPPPELSAD